MAFPPSIPLRDIQRGRSDCAVVLLSLFHAGRSKGDCIVTQYAHWRFLERTFSIRKELLEALWRLHGGASPHSAGPPWIDSVKLSITFKSSVAEKLSEVRFTFTECLIHFIPSVHPYNSKKTAVITCMPIILKEKPWLKKKNQTSPRLPAQH